MEPRQFSRDFPLHRSAPSAARHWLYEILSDTATQSRDDAVLLVSELLTNCVLHAGLGPEETATITVTRDGDRLRVEVCDAGRKFEPRQRPIAEPKDGGYGLRLLEKLAESHGIYSNGVNRVWFELEVADRSLVSC